MITHHIIPYHLKFKYPFHIAHTKREETENSYLILKENNISGIGESVYPPYYPERTADLVQLMTQLEIPSFHSPERVVLYLEEIYLRFNSIPFSIAALDSALLSLASKKFGLSITEVLGFKKTDSISNSSFTLGISSYELMKKKIDENNGFDYYKLKVNQENFHEIINNYTSLSYKTYVVDANQGFKDLRSAKEACQLLEMDNVAYMEQPFDKSDFVLQNKLKEKTSIPLIADESFKGLSDLEQISHYFDGVNIKLMKCGGLVQASKIFLKAKEFNLKTVLGCMSGSSIAIKSAHQLSHLADWVDLDGPFLINNDPHPEFLLNIY